jgi:hypothetical protein
MEAKTSTGSSPVRDIDVSGMAYGENIWSIHIYGPNLVMGCSVPFIPLV